MTTVSGGTGRHSPSPERGGGRRGRMREDSGIMIIITTVVLSMH